MSCNSHRAVQVLQLGLQLSQAVGLKVAAQDGKATEMLFHGSGVGNFGVQRKSQQPCDVSYCSPDGTGQEPIYVRASIYDSSGVVAEVDKVLLLVR